jgi:hypothetical protein
MADFSEGFIEEVGIHVGLYTFTIELPGLTILELIVNFPVPPYKDVIIPGLFH